MKATLSHITKVACPNCAESHHTVSHLFDLQLPIKFGPWSCDSCGFGFKGTINSPEDIQLEWSKNDTMKIPCWDILVLPPQTKPVFFVLKTFDYRKFNEQNYENKEYFYNEHTCPTNWITDVDKIISEGDDDPHGLCLYYKSFSRDPKDTDFAATELLPEAFDDTLKIENDEVE